MFKLVLMSTVKCFFYFTNDHLGGTKLNLDYDLLNSEQWSL